MHYYLDAGIVVGLVVLLLLIHRTVVEEAVKMAVSGGDLMRAETKLGVGFVIADAKKYASQADATAASVVAKIEADIKRYL